MTSSEDMDEYQEHIMSSSEDMDEDTCDDYQPSQDSIVVEPYRLPKNEEFQKHMNKARELYAIDQFKESAISYIEALASNPLHKGLLFYLLTRLDIRVQQHFVEKITKQNQFQEIYMQSYPLQGKQVELKKIGDKLGIYATAKIKKNHNIFEQKPLSLQKSSDESIILDPIALCHLEMMPGTDKKQKLSQNKRMLDDEFFVCSIISHFKISKSPNTKMRKYIDSIRVKAIKEIEQGEELTISLE